MEVSGSVNSIFRKSSRFGMRGKITDIRETLVGDVENEFLSGDLSACDAAGNGKAMQALFDVRA